MNSQKIHLKSPLYNLLHTRYLYGVKLKRLWRDSSVSSVWLRLLQSIVRFNILVLTIVYFTQHKITRNICLSAYFASDEKHNKTCDCSQMERSILKNYIIAKSWQIFFDNFELFKSRDHFCTEYHNKSFLIISFSQKPRSYLLWSNSWIALNCSQSF